METFVIDPELAGLIPPISQHEFDQLEENVLADGCRDPLIVWQEKHLLLDGHNRHKICKKHNISFDVAYLNFASLTDVKIWMIKNQLGRRNLIDYVRVESVLHLEDLIAERGKANMMAGGYERQGLSNLINPVSDPVNTQQELSKMAGVSTGTFHGAKTIATKGTDELKAMARSGDVSIAAAVVVAKLPENTQRAIVSQGPDAIRQAAKEDREFKAEEIVVPNLPLTASNHAVSDTPGYDGDEWYTPKELIESARVVLGTIDLDPASCDAAQEMIKAEVYYTKLDDALRSQCEWFGRVWLNPPYSSPLIKQFVVKLLDQFRKGHVKEAIIITNNCTDTAWFHSLIEFFPACLTLGRAGFWRPDGDKFGARQGQVLFYLGENESKFVEEFSVHGKVVKAI